MKTDRNKQKAIEDNLLQLLAQQAKGQDLFGREGFFHQLKTSLVNKMLEGELDHHLGYSKHGKEPKATSNRRNGSYGKRVVTGEDSLDISIPRDREGEFEPHLVPKGVRRLEGFDDKVISMYARGMSMREIQAHIQEIYGTEVSYELISDVTDKVISEMTAWQNRPLDSLYPIVYLDCLYVKTREGHTIVNKAVYLAVGISLEGQKEVLGLWLNKNEGAKFWLQVVTELKNRGVTDILLACVDGLKGFEEAICSVFPDTTVQLCLVHVVRNSLKFVPWKDKRAVAASLRDIYTAPSEEAAHRALEEFGHHWDKKYPTIRAMWERLWPQIVPCLAYPKEVRKVIYTTNCIESINRQIRKIIKAKGVFPTEMAIKKSVYLALKNATKRWTMPLQDWSLALNQFAILYPDRINRL